MERKHSNQSHPKTGNPTILGTVLFTVFHLILLSILSWFLLEAWITVKIFISDIRNTSLTIQHIVSNNVHIIMHYHPQQGDSALKLFHSLNYDIYSLLHGYINSDIIEIFIGAIEVSVTRLLLFIEFIPFMIAILSVSIIDGLVQRDIRKFQGSRESTLLFHRLKPLAKISLLTLFFIYMLLPYEIPPEFYLIPMAASSSLFTLLTIKNFKKYL
jgi:hypothetical protein